MNIDTLVESFYSKKDETESLINEVLKLLITEQAEGMPPSATFNWSMIPDIPISEIGWSDTRTAEVGGPQGGQRKLLKDYLDKIQGADLKDKLKNLNDFMANPDLAADSPGDKISKILGYLVFYKTLTRVITNFNASSAGFSFESFLAALTGGEQIPTGQETIADYKSGDDFVSLKLYAEGSVEVGGSFQDLVDDLADDTKNNSMIYLVVLKSLEGDGLDQEGTLSFYQFKLTLDNVGNFIDKSAKESRLMMALPLDKNGQLIDLDATKPEEPEEIEEATQRVRPTSKKFIEDFNKTLAAQVKAQLEKRIEQIPELAEVDGLGELVNLIQLGGENFPKLTNEGVKQAYNAIKVAVAEIQAKTPENKKLLSRKVEVPGRSSKSQLRIVIETDFNTILNGLLQSLKRGPEATRKAGAQTLLKSIRVDAKSIDRSIAYYNSLKGNPEMQKKALFSSFGYLGAKKFATGKSVATGKTVVDQMPVEGLGALEIGASRIVPILNQARGELNDQVFGIFKNLKTLSTQINAYFASGLTDEKAGAEASRASKDIATSTEEVTTQK